MGFIQNHSQLAITTERKVVLDLIEAALDSIQPRNILRQKIELKNYELQIADKKFNIKNYNRVFLIGFGKGSSGICQELEKILGDYLTEGFDIDVVDPIPFTKVTYTKGTHPLPSQVNIDYTKNVLNRLSQLTEKDLVLIVICGGGSVLFEQPAKIDLNTLTKTVKALLNSGANIHEMNIVRKHLSLVKGGNLARLLYPATITSLIFSDVPGNDISVIASGPTTKDSSSKLNAQQILEKYNILQEVQLPNDAFIELPTDDKYFTNVYEILIVTNLTALNAMRTKAEELGKKVTIYSDKLQEDAHGLGKTLLEVAQQGTILLAGGESTIKVRGQGKGGRNQALVLSALKHIDDSTIIAAFDSDGWDFYELAGALADAQTKKKADSLGLDPQAYIRDDNSYEFFSKTADGIRTGKLESNVSDLYIVWKYG